MMAISYEEHLSPARVGEMDVLQLVMIVKSTWICHGMSLLSFFLVSLEGNSIRFASQEKHSFLF